ncbi:MAG: 4Fe-4S binding protein, partial [Candidatus Omnitrophica bacterium]|nr:4Fe-4S binding protein [Candidatus Omnitrophota bacterium]
MIRKLPLIRRISQILFWGLFVATLWFTTYPMTGKLSPEVFFITNPLVMVLTAMSERFVLPGLWFAGAMLALTLVLGRFFCGWICPLGAMIDFTAWLKRFSPGGKRILLKKSRAVKFFILGVVVALACLGIQDAWVLDPLGMIARFVSLNFIPFVTRVIDGVFVFMLTVTHRYEPLFDLYRFLKASVLGVKVSYFSHSGIILLLFAVACGISWIAQRFWCRALCPLGALYAVVARWAWLRRVVPECSRCGNCAARCRMGAINADMSYEKHECILCLDCLYDCPQR